MTKVSYYTEEGLKKLRDELNQLKDIERPKASQAIADAREADVNVPPPITSLLPIMSALELIFPLDVTADSI